MLEKHPNPDLESDPNFFGPRAMAWVLDVTLVLVVTAALLAAIGAATGNSLLPMLFYFGFPVWIVGFVYGVGFEGVYGRTPGKAALDLVVVSHDGSTVGPVRAFARNLLRPIDALPAFFLLGGLVAWITEDTQRVGDVLGGTRVVKTAPLTTEELAD